MTRLMIVTYAWKIGYRTVNGDGYKEYQSRGEVCANCQDSINVRKVKNM